MDFKVAGTEKGITALQMDIKITGVTFEILRDALTQAREGRLHILGKMAESITAPRGELSSFAPRISTIQIDPDKIGLLIGKGGETIRGLSEEYEAQIDVEDDGTVRVYAQTGAQGDALVDRIRGMTKEVEVGDDFPGAKVVKTTTFGAFVNLVPGRDGLVHISKLGRGKRLNSVEEAIKEGDKITVLVEDIDGQGKISLKPVGEEWAIPEGQADESGGGRPRGDRDRGGRGGGGGGRDRGSSDRGASDRGSSDRSSGSGDRGERSRGRRFRDGEGASQATGGESAPASADAPAGDAPSAE